MKTKNGKKNVMKNKRGKRVGTPGVGQTIPPLELYIYSVNFIVRSRVRARRAARIIASSRSFCASFASYSLTRLMAIPVTANVRHNARCPEDISRLHPSATGELRGALPVSFFRLLFLLLLGFFCSLRILTIDYDCLHSTVLALVKRRADFSRAKIPRRIGRPMSHVVRCTRVYQMKRIRYAVFLFVLFLFIFLQDR